jgi:hypothetical protein
MPEDERECKGARSMRIEPFDTADACEGDREAYGAAVKRAEADIRWQKIELSSLGYLRE